MSSYVGFILILNFLVNFLLLMGTNSYLGYDTPAKRMLPGALLVGSYSAACLLPVPAWMLMAVFRIFILVVCSFITYGWSKSAVKRSAIFLLLSLFVSAITSGFLKTGYSELIAAALCIVVLFLLRSDKLQSNLVAMELTHNNKKMQVVALNDTGNALRDPITGEGVVVVSPEIAGVFTGLTKKQLSQPVESLHLFPGLRLIPYRCVGRENGFLLALRFSNVKIGRSSGSYLVAFAPEGLGGDCRFQALTGRTI